MIPVAVAGWLGALLAASGVARLRRRLELVARAEHELRGPVSALVVAAEWAARRGCSPLPAIEPHLDRIRLGLADLESARSGRRARPRPQQVDLGRLVDRVAEAFMPALAEAGRRLEIRTATAPLTVAADAARLTQAVSNLLANALEHGRGAVEVSVRRRDDDVHVEVSDAGGGFRPQPGPGRGRGLRAVSDAVEEAGGRVEVAAADRSSSVVLELPARGR